MANNLTGDYEAVLQISVRQLNGILATLHQNGIDKQHSPSFPHSVSIRIGDVPFFATPGGNQFLQWANKAVRNLQEATGSGANARAVLTNKTPAGVAGLFEEAFNQLDRSPLTQMLTVRGRADAQISAPAITISPGAVSELTVHAFVRAHFYPDVGFVGLPSPIHGEVQALYGANVATLPDGSLALRVQVSPNDQQLRFLPEPGTALSPADVQDIEGHVRTALRKEFKAADVPLPPDFAFAEFTSLGTGPTQAAVLPLQLSGGSAPAGRLSTVTNHFLGSDEFALGISREFLQRFIDGVEGSIRGYAARISTGSFRVSVSSFSVSWKSGSIDLAGRIDIVTPSPLPNGFISFRQSITVELDAPSGRVSVKPVGDPAVDESWWLPHAYAVGAVRGARDSAISQASGALNQSFAGARDKLVNALKKFDDSASARYTSLELQPDGIVVCGSIPRFSKALGPPRFPAKMQLPGAEWSTVQTRSPSSFRARRTVIRLKRDGRAIPVPMPTRPPPISPV